MLPVRTIDGVPGLQPHRTPDQKKRRLLRWYGPLRDTHVSLPGLTLLLLAIVWCTTFNFIADEHDRYETNARISVRELGQTYEAQIARSLANIDQTLKMLRYAFDVSGVRGAIPALKEQLLLPPGLIFMISIVDRTGAVVASNPMQAQANVSNTDYFRFHQQHNSNRPFVSALETGSTEPLLAFTRRFNDSHDHFAGMVILKVSPAYFTSGYDHIRQGEHGMLALVGNDNMVRSMRIGDTISGGQHLPPGFGTAPPGALMQSPWDSIPRFISGGRLHGFPLRALVGLSEQEQMAPFTRLRRQYLWGVAAGSLILVFMTGLICFWSWQLSKSRRLSLRDQATYAAASEANLDAFFVMRSVRSAQGTIIDFRIDAANSRAEKMTGLCKRDLIGQKLCTIMPDYRHNGVFADMVKVALSGGVHEAEWKNTSALIRYQWLHRQVVAVEGGIVAIVRDISERKQTEQRIFHLAHHDALTGLANRTMINNVLESAIGIAQHRHTCLAVVFIDLDKFKLINDGLGHDAGDELLRVVSQRMQHCLSPFDTIGRFGGDEFVVILEQPHGRTLAAIPTLTAIQLAVTEQVLIGAQPLRISCSMGVSLYPHDGTDAMTLLKNADAAMYRAKERGSDNFQFYTREMNAQVQSKLRMLEALRDAVESLKDPSCKNSPFELLYQPKVDLRTGTMFGVEALLRWNWPGHGTVAPVKFIPLAEESGLIIALGDWALQTACYQNQAWCDAGLAPLTMSVNVSPRQFEESRLVERVALALQTSGLLPSLLELEVTESLVMRDPQQSIRKMGLIKAMGVLLSIDDFGTGYSNLSALKSFPISRLKIDKSFVTDLADNPDDQAIASAVISLGHKLNLCVIAEGVETVQQLHYLRDNGCDEIQGFLFSRPVRPADIATLMRAAPWPHSLSRLPVRGPLTDTTGQAWPIPL